MRWETKLHFVDSFDEVEESFGAFGIISNFMSCVVGWVENSVIFEILENIAIDVELLNRIHIDFIE